MCDTNVKLTTNFIT